MDNTGMGMGGGGYEMDGMRIEIKVEGCELAGTGFVKAACDL